jgi:hypothetical protein
MCYFYVETSFETPARQDADSFNGKKTYTLSEQSGCAE